MARRRQAETPAESDSRKAIAKSRASIDDARQMMLDAAATIERSTTAGRASRSVTHPAVILKLGPRDYSVLTYDRDEDGEPVYRVVKEKIRAASTAGVLARKLQDRAAAQLGPPGRGPS